MELPGSRVAELIDLAEEVVKSCPPGKVNPSLICVKEKIPLLRNTYKNGGFDGMIVFRHGRWFILVNSCGVQPESPRERFTISHELAHYFIPEHRRQLALGGSPHPSKAGAFDGANCPEELEADIFAANLLMPPSRFAPRLKTLSMTPMRALVILREDFKVSAESIAFQLMQHDPRVVSIAKWNDATDKGQGGLAWHRTAKTFCSHFRRRPFLHHRWADLPVDSATRKALNDSSSNFYAPVRHSKLTAGTCFKNPGHSNNDLIIREESMRLGHFGALTIYSKL